MWWKPFLGNRKGVTKLPQGDLERMVVSSTEEIKKMVTRSKTLRDEISSISVEASRKLLTDGFSPVKSEKTRDFSRFNASEHRKAQLLGKISALKSDIELVDKDLMDLQTMSSLYDQKIVAQKRASDTFVLTSLNSSSMRKTAVVMNDMIERMEDGPEKDQMILCTEILNYDPKRYSKRVSQMRQDFKNKCAKCIEETNGLINEVTKRMKAIGKLHEKMDRLQQKELSVTSTFSPNMKHLEAELEEMGDTHKEFLSIQKTVNSLREKKDQLQSDISLLTSKNLRSPATEDQEMEFYQTISDLTKQKLDLQMEINEMEQRGLCNEVDARDSKSQIGIRTKEIERIEEQTRTINKSIEEERKKIHKLQEANIEPEDVQYILDTSQKFTVSELESTLIRLKDETKRTKKRKELLKRQILQLKELMASLQKHQRSLIEAQQSIPQDI